ncbi:MAG: hypothetical protein AAGC47_06675 [Bacteroidota bacterium]
MGLVIAFLTGAWSRAFAQDFGSFRSKKIALSSDTISLDTLSIDPSSLIVKANDKLVEDSLYTLLAAESKIVWKSAPRPNTIDVEYRVLSIDLTRKYQRRSDVLIQNNVDYYSNPYTYRPEVVQSSVFGSTQLNKTGSISRGLGFGNNQDLTVNSTLSLQLNGKLTEEINVLASVTDDNIPIQPEGNTAQLQEFDQVFIQLYDDKNKLTAGDFIIRRPIGYFSTYFKRAQGASYETMRKVGTGEYEFFTQTSAAISRGKFARNIIQGSEGNQGPYRLRGSEDEPFIIILAGTERVFIDGKEMRRGQQNDYVIDYNTAEVTFTANQLINKDKRIAVEFQYTDANYVRSLIQTSTGIQSDKYKFYVNFFSEQDAKNQSLQQDLTDDDRRILGNAGDDLSLAIALGFEEVFEYSNDRVLYTIVDTLGYDSVLVRITESTSPMFNVNFSEVGDGNGDYNQIGFDASGRIFEWAAPDTINGRISRNGNFAPIRQLVAPKRNQLFMAGANAQFNERTSATVELGFSNDDQNTFSEIGNDNNLSHGLFAKVEHKESLSAKPNAAEVFARAMIESRGDNFRPIEPYRSVEFTRNWNLNDSLEDNEQNIITGAFGIRRSQKYDLTYSLDRFDAGSDYVGIKNNLNANFSLDGFRGWFIGSILDTEGAIESKFARHKSLVEKDLWFTKIGFTDEREDNLRFNPGSDTLSDFAYKFYDWQFYLANLDSSEIGYKIFYRERTDFAAAVDDYSESTHAVHYGAELSMLTNPRNTLRATVSNRILEIVDEESTNQVPEETLLMRLEYGSRFWKNTITTNTFYEIGSGLERRQEFIYILDPTGQGPFTWIDYNENGIKELNEFETARPEDGERYLRVFTPTDDYERAFSNQFSQSLNINPAGIWMREEGIKKILARFSNQTAFRIQRKTRKEDEADRFNPFANPENEENLISQSSSIRNTFFFNRSSSKFGADYTFSDQTSKTPLTSGFEERDNFANILRVRYNFTSKYGAILEQEFGTRQSASDFLEGRNYTIDYLSLKPTFSYQPSTEFRLNFTGQFTNKENAQDLGGETADIVDFGADARLSQIEKGTYFIQINYITIDYVGQANNSLSYEMLDGLQNGENITWGAGIQRQLGRNLQLSLTYNGRKSEESRAIHTGNVQVRAFF